MLWETLRVFKLFPFITNWCLFLCLLLVCFLFVFQWFIPSVLNFMFLIFVWFQIILHHQNLMPFCITILFTDPFCPCSNSHSCFVHWFILSVFKFTFPHFICNVYIYHFNISNWCCVCNLTEVCFSSWSYVYNLTGECYKPAEYTESVCEQYESWGRRHQSSPASCILPHSTWLQSVSAQSELSFLLCICRTGFRVCFR